MYTRGVWFIGISFTFVHVLLEDVRWEKHRQGHVVFIMFDYLCEHVGSVVRKRPSVSLTVTRYDLTSG